MQPDSAPSALKRPNVVLVITDQQRFDTIAAAGFDYMLTPNLDRLVREGVCFDRMFVTAPPCAPSRASLFTGLYPHTTGMFRNDEPWTHTWVRQLAETGYRTVNVGKMHTSPAGRHRPVCRARPAGAGPGPSRHRGPADAAEEAADATPDA